MIPPGLVQPILLIHLQSFELVFKTIIEKKTNTQIFILFNDLQTLRSQSKLVAGSTNSVISKMHNVSVGDGGLHSPLCTPVVHKICLCRFTSVLANMTTSSAYNKIPSCSESNGTPIITAAHNCGFSGGLAHESCG